VRLLGTHIFTQALASDELGHLWNADVDLI